MKKNVKNQELGWRILFVLYLIVLTYFLFFSERYGRSVASGYKYNVTPFTEIKRYIVYYKSFTLEQIILNLCGNIIAFVPFGFFLPLINKNNRSFLFVAFCGCFASLFVEFIQLITKVGSFDVDDIILNTTGGILGYAVYFFAVEKRKNKSKGTKKKKTSKR